MLKTAILTTLLCTFLGGVAFSAEAPAYDRKIERAAIAQVAKKMGGLRESMTVDVPMSASADLDMAQTAGIAEQPNEPRFHALQTPKNFWFVAGVYDQ